MKIGQIVEHLILVRDRTDLLSFEDEAVCAACNILSKLPNMIDDEDTKEELQIHWIEVQKINGEYHGVKSDVPNYGKVIVTLKSGWVCEAKWFETEKTFIRLVGTRHYEPVDTIYEDNDEVLAYRKMPPPYKKEG